MFDNRQNMVLNEIISALTENEEPKTERVGTIKRDKNSEVMAIKMTGIKKEDVTIERIGYTLHINGETKDSYIDATYRFHNSIELNKNKVIDNIDAKMENGILYLFVNYKEKETTIEQTIKIK